MPWSNNGTVQVSSGGTTATGTGTTFLSGARVGDALTIAGSTSLHEVTAIASDTQLTFQPPYTGTTGSGKAYRIAPIMGYDKDLSDAFNSIRLQWGTQLSSLQPWATAATADIALGNLGGSATGAAVFKGNQAAGRTALELGTAATRAVQTSPIDTTAGALMAVGAGGWMGRASENSYIAGFPQSIANNISQVYRRADIDSGVPAFNASFHFAAEDTWGRVRISFNAPRAWIQGGIANGTGWTAELYHTANILGTVSQSGGIPTGAIIERGSNANGEYVRYADGTQICQRRIEFTTNKSSNLGRVSDPVIWSYPAHFSQQSAGGQEGMVSVFGTASNTADAFFAIPQNIGTLYQTGLNMYKIDSSTDSTRGLNITAIGRWY